MNFGNGHCRGYRIFGERVDEYMKKIFGSLDSAVNGKMVAAQSEVDPGNDFDFTFAIRRDSTLEIIFVDRIDFDRVGDKYSFHQRSRKSLECRCRRLR